MALKTISAKRVYDSLSYNYVLHLQKLNSSKYKYIEGNDEIIKKIFELVFIKNKEKFLEVPNVIKNTLVKYVYDCLGTDNEDFVSRLIDKKIIPITYLPIDGDYVDDELIDSRYKNYDEKTYLGNKIKYYTPKRYCKEDEMIYIKLLGKKYKSCKSVEDVLRVMNEMGLVRDTMSLMEMFAIKLYACKILHNEGVNLDVKVFGVDEEMESSAIYDEKMIKLNINGSNNTIIEMIDSLHHEIIHSIQDKNIKECNIAYDNDIDIYCKDMILRELMGNFYYESNYGAILYEFDAEFKSKMMTAKVFDLVNINYDGRISSMNKNAIRMVDYARKKVLKKEYNYSGERDCRSINELFESNMEATRKRNIGRYNELLKKHPIIEYEYKTKNCFKRKSIKELLNEINKSKNKKEIGIYYNLLKTRVNDCKEDLDDYYEAIEILEKIYKKNNYNEVTNKILKHLVEVDIKNSDYSKKYIGFFNKKGFNKQ